MVGPLRAVDCVMPGALDGLAGMLGCLEQREGEATSDHPIDLPARSPAASRYGRSNACGRCRRASEGEQATAGPLSSRVVDSIWDLPPGSLMELGPMRVIDAG